MNEPRARILVVEDEPEIRRFVCAALAREGFETYEADGVARAAIEAGTRRPDLVVVDLGLPDGDGVDLIRQLRTWTDMPVLVLSARGEEPQKVEALDAGADDYLVKPFGAGELLARVRAQLRRRALGADGSAVLDFGGVRIDRARRRSRGRSRARGRRPASCFRAVRVRTSRRSLLRVASAGPGLHRRS